MRCGLRGVLVLLICDLGWLLCFWVWCYVVGLLELCYCVFVWVLYRYVISRVRGYFLFMRDSGGS